MKAGIALNLFVAECLAETGVRLNGDLVFESVVDEEFGGCVGTLAGRVRGDTADAAIITEPSSLRICPAQRGGRTAQVQLRGLREGVLDTGRGFPKGAVPQLTYLLDKLPEFAEQRRAQCTRHAMYASDPDPVPVSVTKVYTSPWGWNEPLTVPETARVEIYWQLMPGEEQQVIEREFLSWIDSLVEAKPELFVSRPQVVFPMSWLPGSSISSSEPLVTELAACAEQVLGTKPPVAGIEGPCDLFVFHEFGIPAVLWGPRGGNIHAADEYVEIDSLVTAAEVLLVFAADWCGIPN
jgi:acetylornithine deacetylase